MRNPYFIQLYSAFDTIDHKLSNLPLKQWVGFSDSCWILKFLNGLDHISQIGNVSLAVEIRYQALIIFPVESPREAIWVSYVCP